MEKGLFDASLPVLPALLLASAYIILYYLYRNVSYWRFKQHAAWPQPAPSFLWGHAHILGSDQHRGLPKRHSDYAFAEVHENLGRPPAFLMDIRPFVGWPVLIVANAELAEQASKISKENPWSFPKSPTTRDLKSLLGPQSVILQNGEKWKGLRRRFNPGFAPQHLVKLLPCILDKTQYFLDHLDRHARDGDVFSLSDLTINLTFDIIGAVVMDVDFDAQLPIEQQSEIIRLYRELVHTYADPDARLPRPLALLRRYRTSRRLNTLVKSHITTYFAEQSRLQQAKRSRSVLALSLQGLETLDPATVDATCDQLRSFLFAGHDTTSITLQWALYELSRTPRALAALRREMDDLFGADPDPAVVRARLLSGGEGDGDGTGENLVFKMPYASAVIKETLRLYPPAATARLVPQGSGVTIAMPDGSQSPCVDGLVFYNCQYLIHRDPAVYGDTANDFVPERWLGNTDTWMTSNDDDESGSGGGGGNIPASAWRPFERGPRNCIGQELANIESRVILACVVRKFDFVKVGLGELAVDEKGQPILDVEKGQYKVVSSLYNTREITAKPIDGVQMKVKLSSRMKSGPVKRR